MKKSIRLQAKWPYTFQKNSKFETQAGYILAADIGGTNARFALFNLHNKELKLLRESTYKTKDYPSLNSLLSKFGGEDFNKIKSLCIGVAGPVNKGKVKGTNFAWIIDENDIIEKTNIGSVSVINDLEATAYGIGLVATEDFISIKKGTSSPGNLAIISPGTGLGEAGLYWNGSFYQPFASEGGHCDFSPRNEMDLKLWRFLHEKYGHVSWERLISGSGIVNIYQFLKSSYRIEEPKWFQERLLNEDPAVLISNCAKEKTYAICIETIDLFVRFLAIEAAQLALKFKATGGIFIGGGILPKILEIVDKQKFQQEFVNSNRMNSLLELIEVKIIFNEQTAIYGAAYYASRQMQ